MKKSSTYLLAVYRFTTGIVEAEHVRTGVLAGVDQIVREDVRESKDEPSANGVIFVKKYCSELFSICTADEENP